MLLVVPYVFFLQPFELYHFLPIAVAKSISERAVFRNTGSLKCQKKKPSSLQGHALDSSQEGGDNVLV
jgi:hypothetical protein